MSPLSPEEATIVVPIRRSVAACVFQLAMIVASMACSTVPYEMEITENSMQQKTLRNDEVLYYCEGVEG